MLMKWLGRSDKFKRNSPEDMLETADAYRRVFMSDGRASNEDKEIVLADMANAAGFYTVSEPSASSEARAFADGQRSVIARLHSFLQMPPDMRWQLEAAVRAEAYADAQAETEASQ